MSNAAVATTDALPAQRRRVAPGISLIVGSVFMAIVLAGVVASFTMGDRVTDQVLVDRLMPPMWHDAGSSQHILGTDSLGRDLLARILAGMATSVFIAFLAVAIGLVIGVAVGLLTGYVGGWVDAVFMRIADAVLAIPMVLFAIAVIAIIGGGAWNLIAVIAFSQWMAFARNTRGETLIYREMLYTTAARSVGAGRWRIIRRHILPHTIPSTVVLATLGISSAVLSEAALSFLGVGIQPPTPSLGGMLAEGREFISTAPWLGILPGIAIFILVFGVNLIGEAIRDRVNRRTTR